MYLYQHSIFKKWSGLFFREIDSSIFCDLCTMETKCYVSLLSSKKYLTQSGLYDVRPLARTFKLHSLIVVLFILFFPFFKISSSVQYGPELKASEYVKSPKESLEGGDQSLSMQDIEKLQVSSSLKSLIGKIVLTFLQAQSISTINDFLPNYLVFTSSSIRTITSIG